MAKQTVTHNRDANIKGVLISKREAVVSGKVVTLYVVKWDASLASVPMSWRCEKNPKVRGYYAHEITIA